MTRAPPEYMLIFLPVESQLKSRLCRDSLGAVLGAAVGLLLVQAAWPAPMSDQAIRETAHDIFKQLIEINTTDSVG